VDAVLAVHARLAIDAVLAGCTCGSRNPGQPLLVHATFVSSDVQWLIKLLLGSDGSISLTVPTFLSTQAV
jgi:hypothetical protein